MTELFTTKEIAQYLRLRPETVLRKVKEGAIPAIKIGGRFRFDKEQIDGWLRDNHTSREDSLGTNNHQASVELFETTLKDSSYHVLSAQPVTR